MNGLFEMDVLDAACGLLHAMRMELQRELSAAVAACEEVPDFYLDQARAAEVFHELAADGDEAAAREEIRACFDMAAGFARHFDRMMDHVNTLGWAYWRLYRAERRAYEHVIPRHAVPG